MRRCAYILFACLITFMRWRRTGRATSWSLCVVAVTQSVHTTNSTAHYIYIRTLHAFTISLIHQLAKVKIQSSRCRKFEIMCEKEQNNSVVVQHDGWQWGHLQTRIGSSFEVLFELRLFQNCLAQARVELKIIEFKIGSYWGVRARFFY